MTRAEHYQEICNNPNNFYTYTVMRYAEIFIPQVSCLAQNQNRTIWMR